MGETISAAKFTFVCVVSGLFELLRSFLRALFVYLSVHQLLFPCLEVLVQSASPPHAVGCKVLPGLSVDVEFFHVSLTDILIAQLLAAFGSPSRCQLSIQNVFWDAAILHAVDMTQPTQPVLCEQGEHAWKVGSGQDLGVGHSVLPGFILDTAGACQLGVEFFSCLTYVVHVSLSCISVLTTQTLYTTILVFTVNLGLIHTRDLRRTSVVAAFPIILSISVSKERLSVMVETRFVNCSTTSNS